MTTRTLSLIFDLRLAPLAAMATALLVAACTAAGPQTASLNGGGLLDFRDPIVAQPLARQFGLRTDLRADLADRLTGYSRTQPAVALGREIVIEAPVNPSEPEIAPADITALVAGHIQTQYVSGPAPAGVLIFRIVDATLTERELYLGGGVLGGIGGFDDGGDTRLFYRYRLTIAVEVLRVDGGGTPVSLGTATHLRNVQIPDGFNRDREERVTAFIAAGLRAVDGDLDALLAGG